ncbi:MAG: hypothetical protein E7667_02505 [Ruminococcaceae bacterium]|nr:hypothetical protein [Oscillospiraceae bacterium]
MTNNLGKKIAISGVIGTVLTALTFYFWLPAINVFDPGFWIFLIITVLFYAIPYALAGREKREKFSVKNIFTKGKAEFKPRKKASVEFKIFVGLIGAFVFILIVGSLMSSKIFNARKYAQIIQVKEAVFAEDMQESQEITNIALMDSESAKIIGNRALDKLSDVVSQFVAGEQYSQINYNGSPKKVTGLEYADFFKWMNNKGTGIPGYIMVDPVRNEAKYVKLEKTMKYAESGYFGDDLYRKLRLKYPTKIFDYISFEVDESGNPYYIVSCVKPKIFPFGAKDVSEVIIFDPCTGDSKIYDVDKTPSWIDTSYSGDLAVEKYNWYGTLSGGFINSIIGNKGCKMTTDDYGYITIGDDVWYFTGVTSVTADSSNIGFILTNARTGEYKYYAVGGAEEHSAMEAAQGEVQEKGYVASFPSLVNISGEATYIMVLKDDNGIVKLYALVNVENYNIVATGQTQAEVMAAYKKLLVQNGVLQNNNGNDAEEGNPKVTVQISGIEDFVISSNTVRYFTGSDGYRYKGTISDDEGLILLYPGQTLEIEYTETDIEGIRQIVKYKEVVTE